MSNPNAIPNEREDGDDWQVYAKCRGTDPDIFFPKSNTGPALAQIAAAKTICDACVVKADCLDYALTTNQDSGIWGGITETERRQIRRQWLAAKRRA